MEIVSKNDAGNDTLFGLIQPPKVPFTGNNHLLWKRRD